LDTVRRLAHHLESDGTAHGEATQRKSVGRRCEDRSGDPTHRAVSRVICDTYRDLSSQRGDLFGEKILGANQPWQENKMCRTCCHDASAPSESD
jgi:hypothetical protein